MSIFFNILTFVLIFYSFLQIDELVFWCFDSHSTGAAVILLFVCLSVCSERMRERKLFFFSLIRSFIHIILPSIYLIKYHTSIRNFFRNPHYRYYIEQFPSTHLDELILIRMSESRIEFPVYLNSAEIASAAL